MKSPRIIFASVGALAVLAVGCSSDDTTAADTTTTAAEAPTTTAADTASAGTIVDVAASNPDFSTLVAAVQAAGLVDTLSGPGPFTVFAPTDEAFTAALASLNLTADQLLADPTLGDILTYHVVPGTVLAADVAGLDGQDVTTVNGATVKVSVSGGTVMINDAKVTMTDIEASNGVIHVIDSVLLPPS